MDASRFALTFAVLMIGIGIGRFVLSTAGRAGEGMATLFVPPDRTLGWPRGIQESDEPWACRERAAATRPPDPDDGGRAEGPPGDLPTLIEPRHGGYVVPVARVAPVHHRVRPH
jgi:hypothetical protein